MKKAIFMTLAVVLFTCVAAVFAAEKAHAVQKLSGEVVKVDAKAGSITIKADGKEHALKAEAKLLEGVNAGDKVEVEAAQGKVKSLKKVEEPKAPTPAPTPQQAPK